jgi:hypothetical protein
MNPIEIIDEHHEAYLCIEGAARRGLIKRPATLVHVDSHSDLELPPPTGSCYGRDSKGYVEEHINIGSYIAPLILKGIVGEVVFVGLEDRRQEIRRIGSFQGKGRHIRMVFPDKAKGAYPDRRAWRLGKATDIGKVRAKGCILDIDCDYFSCNFKPRAPFDLKLNRAQKGRVARYLRSDDSFSAKLNVLSIPGRRGPSRFLPVFNAERRWVEACADHFTSSLRIEPALTIISRSVKSGYTPPEFADMIVERLVKGLEERPDRLRYPERSVPRFRDEVFFRNGVIHSALTGQFYSDLSPSQLIVLNGIKRGRTLRDIVDSFRRYHRQEREEAACYVLTYLFVLKRSFFVA